MKIHIQRIKERYSFADRQTMSKHIKLWQNMLLRAETKEEENDYRELIEASQDIVNKRELYLSNKFYIDKKPCTFHRLLSVRSRTKSDQKRYYYVGQVLEEVDKTSSATIADIILKLYDDYTAKVLFKFECGGYLIISLDPFYVDILMTSNSIRKYTRKYGRLFDISDQDLCFGIDEDIHSRLSSIEKKLGVNCLFQHSR